MKMRLKLITWNVAEGSPPKDLGRLLGLDAKFLPDIYAIGLQELKSSPRMLLTEALKNDAWTRAISTTLFPRDYVRVQTVRMMGIHLAVYIKRVHLLYVTNVETKYTRTGFGGTWGNKGAVSMRMDVYGVNVCFVNCHFTAHLPNYCDRIQDYDDIIDRQTFSDPECSNILDHDYVFWFGDLNFRLKKYEKTEIEKKIKEIEYASLLEEDQLKSALRDELILVDFEEGPITFAPSYKFDPGTDTYDTSKKQRKPAWCDRILYMVHEDTFEGVELGVHQHSYTSLMDYKNSDHKPVVSELDFVVLDCPPELPVMFEPLNVWCCSQHGKCSYAVSTDLTVSSWDWIGLYRSNFKDSADYVTYVWAPTDGDKMKDQDCKLYHFKINKSHLKDLVGEFYVAYFNVKKNCLVGYSNLFTISLVEESSDSDSNIDSSDEDDMVRKKRI